MKALLPALIALAMGVVLIGCAISAQEFSKNDWTITNVHCPRMCAPDAEAFVRSYLGRSARISAREFALPFLDHCDGTISYTTLRRSSDQVRAELETIAGAPIQRERFDALSLPGNVTTSIVFCTHNGSTSPLARLLSIESSRIFLLFEGLAVVELR
jgi:hypothetical protein